MALPSAVPETHEDHVIQLFLGHFDRAPEYEALQYYNGRYAELLAGQSDPLAQLHALRALAEDIYRTGQAALELPPDSEYSNEDYVANMYDHILGRPAAEDAAGYEYWVNSLAAGEPRQDVIVAFLYAAEGSERDAAFMANRTTVAAEFARPENSGPDVLPTLEYNAAEILEGVTEDPATVEPALERLASAGEAQQHALTDGADMLTGGAGDDVFNASATEDGRQTLGSDDAIDGGDGWNKVVAELVASDPAGDSVAPQLTNVQGLELSVRGVGAAGIDLANAQDLEVLTVNGAGDGATLEVTNAGDLAQYVVSGAGTDTDTDVNVRGVQASAVDLGFIDTTTTFTLELAAGGPGSANVSLAGADVDLGLQAVEGQTLDAFNVALNAMLDEGETGPRPITLMTDGITRLNVDASSDTPDVGYVLDLAAHPQAGGAPLQALGIAGNQTVDFAWTGNTPALATIDASANTAGVNIDASAYAGSAEQVLDITGTTADDTFRLTDHISVAGNGGNDTYIITEGTDASTVDIRDLDEGDRLQFESSEGTSTLAWNGDAPLIGADVDLGLLGLDGAVDLALSGLGDNQAGWFQFDGRTYVVARGDEADGSDNAIVNLGADVDLLGTSLIDGVLTL